MDEKAAARRCEAGSRNFQQKISVTESCIAHKTDMTPILIWFGAYVLPALIADSIVVFRYAHASKSHKHWLNAAIIHFALILSILGSQYALHVLHLDFPWNLNIYSLVTLALGALLSFGVLRSLGVWYLASSVVQEFTLLSIGFLLLQYFSFSLVALLVIPVFVFSHPLRARHWFLRFILIMLWGVISLWLFTLFHNVWVIATLHAVLGALLIKNGILYPKSRYRARSYS